MWKILARQRRWVHNCTITESINTDTGERRFTATIDGWQNFRIKVVAQSSPQVAEEVGRIVRSIRDRIESGDESIFEEHVQAW